MLKIEKIFGTEIIDSRANPTVSATVILSDGSVGIGIAPSGASTGKFEAHELRDGDKNRFGGKGVLKAVNIIDTVIAPKLCQMNFVSCASVDKVLIELDGTENKSNLGANSVLAVSMAVAKALAIHYKMPLFRYIGGVSARKMPIPMMNIINGGAHASNNIDIQEFMIMPVGIKNFKEGLRASTEIYHCLGDLLKSKGFAVSVGDEGGFAPNLSADEEAIETIIKAIEKAGYSTNEVKIALDAAGSEWYNGHEYLLPKRQKKYSSQELIDYWKNLCQTYPIISLEDPLSEDDWQGWTVLTNEIGDKVQIVGDDLFVTNKKRLKQGIQSGAGNAILIKPNQIGTVTETIDTVIAAKRGGFKTIISHRSGETEDTFIADLSVALNSGQIKTGAPCRSDRTAKYNRLIRIMEMT
ncbi:MAG: phosphopyruvate hydratase [Clostridia bacterium]